MELNYLDFLRQQKAAGFEKEDIDKCWEDLRRVQQEREEREARLQMQKDHEEREMRERLELAKISQTGPSQGAGAGLAAC